MMATMDFEDRNTMLIICLVISALILALMWKLTNGYTVNKWYLYVLPLCLYAISLASFIALFTSLIPSGPAQMKGLGAAIYCACIATVTAIGEMVIWTVKNKH